MLIGVLMIVAGAGLLLPPAWTLCSPFLLQLVGSSSSAGVTWMVATLAGLSLMVMGVRRMLPVRSKAPS
jgi:predicted phage tail protein